MVKVFITAAFFLITTTWLIAVLRAKDIDLPQGRRRMIRLWVAIQVVLFGLLVYGAWPSLPPALANRDIVVERFMTAVANGDSDGAIAMTMIDDEAEVADLQSAISDPANQPVSWELGPLNNRHILVGTAVYPDGKVSDVLISLEWEWSRARWAVDGFEFENSPEENRMRAWAMSYFEPYNYLVGILQVLSLLSLYFVFRMARQEKRWAVEG